jgi:hypothetical protein
VSKEYSRIFGKKKKSVDLLFKKLRYIIHVKEIAGDPDENKFPLISTAML